MDERTLASRSSLFSVIALGIILVLMGIPFVGMAVMMVMLLSRENGLGLPLALGTLIVVYLLSEFNGALVAAVGSGIAAVLIHSGRSYRLTSALTASAAALAMVFVTILIPEHSLISSDSMEVMVQLYRSAGMSSEEAYLILSIIVYILPAVLAVWAACGAIAAFAAARTICTRRKTWPRIAEGEPLKLGLLPAWILILALSANLLGSLPEYLRQAAVNVSLFMVVPYTAVGIAVFRRFLALFPQSLFLALLVGVVFPPLAVGILVIIGILDTWMDFRSRILKIKERNEQQ